MLLKGRVILLNINRGVIMLKWQSYVVKGRSYFLKARSITPPFTSITMLLQGRYMLLKGRFMMLKGRVMLLLVGGAGTDECGYVDPGHAARSRRWCPGRVLQ